MKNDVCPTRETLLAYLERPSSAPTDETLERHLKKCADCRKIVGLGRAIPRDIREQFSAIGKALTRSVPQEYRFGQIWRARRGRDGNSEGILAIITAGTDDSLDPTDPDVRLVPFSFGVPEDLCRRADDIRLGKSHSDLRLSGVAEAWNDRPVLVRDLEAFLGELTPSGCRLLRNGLAAFSELAGKKPDLTDRERLYRFSRIERSAVLSAGYLERLAEGAPARAVEAGPSPEADRRMKGKVGKSGWRNWAWRLITNLLPSEGGFAFQAEGSEPPFERFRARCRELCSLRQVFLEYNTLGKEGFVLTLTEDVPAKALVFFDAGRKLGIRPLENGRATFRPKEPFDDISGFDEVRLS